VKEPYKMTITKVSVNEGLDDALFGKPRLQAVVTNTPAAPGGKAPKSTGKTS